MLLSGSDETLKLTTPGHTHTTTRQHRTQGISETNSWECVPASVVRVRARVPASSSQNEAEESRGRRGGGRRERTRLPKHRVRSKVTYAL